VLRDALIVHVLIAEFAADVQQATVASTSDVQHALNGRRPDPAATPASFVPVVTMMDFMAACPESRDPFLPDARASKPGRRLRLVTLAGHPDDE
jgi:hypothetical protein